MLLLFGACVPILTSPPDTSDYVPWVAPENSWPTAEPPEGLRGEGAELGAIADDFRLTDQYGAEVSLWQFYGSTIVLDVSTMWCAPCQELAAEAQAMADEYRADGLVYVTVIPENVLGGVPTVDELLSWSTSFELYEPILADGVGYTAPIVPAGGYPVILIIDVDMVIVDRIEGEPDFDGAIRASLDALL